MDNILKTDLHIHTTVSDGTDTPKELLSLAEKAGLYAFSVTDHDGIKGCEIIRSILSENDIAPRMTPRFINGVEFSCRDEEGKYHILGYGFDPDAESVRSIVALGHKYRINKVQSRLDFLNSEFGFSFPDDEIRQLLEMENPGKPHIGNLMVKYGCAPTKEEAIHGYIDKLRFKSEYVRPEEAIAGIRSGGGIPVLAHPAFGSGSQMITGEEMDLRLRRLIGYGLRGIEAYYSKFDPKLRNEMLVFADRYDLLVTAGSDYHGKNQSVYIGETGLDEAAAIPARLRRFLEEVS